MKTDDISLYKMEVEFQNQELACSQVILEETLDLYSQLYDYAAVTCTSFDDRGCITDINLTGAALLGVNRDQLIGVPLARFLQASSVPIFFAHVKRCRLGAPKVTSRLNIERGPHVIPVFLLSVARPGRPSDQNDHVYHQSSILDLRDIGAF